MFPTGGGGGHGLSLQMTTEHAPLPENSGFDQTLGMSGVDLDMGDFNMAMSGADSFAQAQNQQLGGHAQSGNDNGQSFSAPNNVSTGGTEIGAGPQPTGFGVPLAGNPGSTLTEFTKRRNWSKLVLEELRDLLLILSPDSRVQYASPSCKLLTGFEPIFLLTKFFTDFLHHDDKTMFLREFNESIASGQQLRFFYRFRKEDGSSAIFEAHGHPHLASDANGYGGGRSCRGVFIMSRPYPTKNAALLDSFLEHKIENERLIRRIAELKQEEQEEQEQQEQQWKSQLQAAASVSDAVRTDGPQSGALSNHGSAFDGMPPPAKPSISNIALTRQNLDEALAAHRPDSINDKMARYEGASHIETIEMLTGLRYRDGERSEGISTGATSPALIRGDIGIPVLVDRENRMNANKQKKLKVADEYVCTDCGTLDSPEWRKGPNGPKTLCNACGLRWAKKEKKRQSLSGSIGPSSLKIQSSTGSG